MSGLVSGLQNRVRRFESARNLKMPARAGFFYFFFLGCSPVVFPPLWFLFPACCYFFCRILCVLFFVKTDKDCRIGNIFV